MRNTMTKETPTNPQTRQMEASSVNWNKPVTLGRFETAMTAVHGDSASLRSEMDALRSEMDALRSEMRAFRFEMHADMVALRADLEKQMMGVEMRLDRRISDLESRMIRWNVMTLIAVIGTIVAAAAYLSNLPM